MDLVCEQTATFSPHDLVQLVNIDPLHWPHLIQPGVLSPTAVLVVLDVQPVSSNATIRWFAGHHQHVLVRELNSTQAGVWLSGAWLKHS